MHQNIEIALNKNYLLWAIVGSLVFLMLGIMLASNPGAYVNSILTSKSVILILACLAIVVFGFFVILAWQKLRSKQMGLVINDTGVIDNSSANSVGLVEWADISDVKMVRVMSIRCLILITDKPEKYIAKAGNSLERKVLELNYKRYGSPIAISTNSLKINSVQLEQLLKQRLAQARPSNLS